MRIAVVVTMMLGAVWLAGVSQAGEEADGPRVEKAPPPPVSRSETADEKTLREDAEIVRKNIFLPAVAEEPEPPARTSDQTAEAPAPTPLAAPMTPDAEKPEDFMVLTGIVIDDGVRQAVIENRRTNQEPVFLKKGDPLGEGVIVDIATYHVTVREWDVERKIGLGFTVSGKRDPYVPPPPAPLVASAPSTNQAQTSEARATVPPWPGRTVWNQWTPEQQREFVRRRSEAGRQVQASRSRDRHRDGQ